MLLIIIIELQKAEQALANWEAALKYERKAQYKYLKERVRLQKQLIKQNDHYTQLLREEAELQRQKVLPHYPTPCCITVLVGSKSYTTSSQGHGNST